MGDFRDRASEAIDRVRERQEKELLAEPKVDPTPQVFPEGKALLRKLKPEWSPKDRAALEQIRAAAQAQTQDIFAGAMVALDQLYQSVRTPRLSPVGTPLKDSQGRTLWEVDGFGRPVSDWSLLDGYAIEQCLLDISEIKLLASQRVTQLKQEALFAKYGYDDAHFSSYEGVVEGTVGDRNAAANRKTIDEKYNYWLRYYLYDMANVFLEELKAVERLLTNIRYWHIRETQ